jgi:hypothetical protein
MWNLKSNCMDFMSTGKPENMLGTSKKGILPLLSSFFHGLDSKWIRLPRHFWNLANFLYRFGFYCRASVGSLLYPVLIHMFMKTLLVMLKETPFYGVWGVWVTRGDKYESQVVVQRVVRSICTYVVDKDTASIFRFKLCHNSEMSMYVGAVILRRSQGVMPYDVKFLDISERIWKEVDLAWLSYYSTICMDGLRKPHITSFFADVRFCCPTVFWSEGMVCKYVADFDVSAGPFSGQRRLQTLQTPWAGCTNTTLVSAQTEGHTHAHASTHARTHAHIFLPIRYARSSHSHDYKDLLTFRKKHFHKFLPEDENLNFHRKFLCVFICTISVHTRRSSPALRPTQSSTQ